MLSHFYSNKFSVLKIFAIIFLISLKLWSKTRLGRRCLKFLVGYILAFSSKIAHVDEYYHIFFDLIIYRNLYKTQNTRRWIFSLMTEVIPILWISNKKSLNIWIINVFFQYFNSFFKILSKLVKKCLWNRFDCSFVYLLFML